MKTLLAVSIIHSNNLPHVQANNDTWKVILTLLFSFTGAISLLMMVVAGLRYITSSGDPNEVAKAKRQILYTAIGLMVSIMAAVIVTFVLGGIHI